MLCQLRETITIEDTHDTQETVHFTTSYMTQTLFTCVIDAPHKDA